MRKIITIALISTFLSCGCILKQEQLKLPNFNLPTKNVAVKVDDLRGLIPKIKESLKDASKADCLFLYKVYSGASEHVKNATGLKNTSDIFPPTGIMKTVATDYQWVSGKEKAFTDLVEADYIAQDLKKPQELTATIREKLVSSFAVYAEGCRQAAEGKK